MEQSHPFSLVSSFTVLISDNILSWSIPFHPLIPGGVRPARHLLAVRMYILRRTFLRHHGRPGDQGPRPGGDGSEVRANPDDKSMRHGNARRVSSIVFNGPLACATIAAFAFFVVATYLPSRIRLLPVGISFYAPLRGSKRSICVRVCHVT